MNIVYYLFHDNSVLSLKIPTAHNVRFSFREFTAIFPLSEITAIFSGYQFAFSEITAIFSRYQFSFSEITAIFSR